MVTKLRKRIVETPFSSRNLRLLEKQKLRITDLVGKDEVARIRAKTEKDLKKKINVRRIGSIE